MGNNSWINVTGSKLSGDNRKIETYIFICFKKAILVKNTVGEDTIHKVKQNLLWFGNGISVFISKFFNPDV